MARTIADIDKDIEYFRKKIDKCCELRAEESDKDYRADYNGQIDRCNQVISDLVRERNRVETGGK